MKKLLFEFEIDDLQPEEEMDAADIYGMVYQRFPLSLISVKAVEQSFAPDGAYWVCPKCNSFCSVKFDTCGLCKSPRR